LGPDFPTGQGAGVLAVADTKKRGAGGSGDGTDEDALALDTAIVAIDTEVLSPATGLDFGDGGVARSGAVAVITKDVGVFGVSQFGKEKKSLGADGGVDDESIGFACFRVARDFAEVGLEFGAAAVGENFGGGVAEVVGIVMLEGNFEGVDVLFPDGVKTFGQLEAVANDGGEGENGDEGDDDQQFRHGETRPQLRPPATAGA